MEESAEKSKADMAKSIREAAQALQREINLARYAGLHVSLETRDSGYTLNGVDDIIITVRVYDVL